MARERTSSLTEPFRGSSWGREPQEYLPHLKRRPLLRTDPLPTLNFDGPFPAIREHSGDYFPFGAPIAQVLSARRPRPPADPARRDSPLQRDPELSGGLRFGVTTSGKNSMPEPRPVSAALSDSATKHGEQGQSGATYALTRSVRFCVFLSEKLERRALASPRLNSFAAWPPMMGLGVFCEISVTCIGPADADTGYVININDIDAAVRSEAIPLIGGQLRESPDSNPAMLLPTLHERIEAALPLPISRLQWRLTPHHTLVLEGSDMGRYVLGQQFDFAAAHRLHSPALSEEENRAAFGKCNNPNGHGHNYRLEVRVRVPIPGTDPAEETVDAFTVLDLERIVRTEVIDRFDHAHLNLDTEEFADLIPSVEHIARVCHERLAPAVAAAGAELAEVTVWETEKTSCTYPA